MTRDQAIKKFEEQRNFALEILEREEIGFCKPYEYDRERMYIERIELAEIALSALKEELPHWIPVTERLPENTLPPRDVLVYHDLKCGMFIDRAWYSHEKRKWRSVLGMNLNVTHWMPLPEPPKEESYD